MPQKHGAQRRRQRQRVQRRNRHRDADRHRELAEQGSRDTGDKGDRHKHRKQHERDRDDRARNLGHGFFGRVGRRQFRLFFHDAFDIFDNDDRVVDQNADRQHHRQQRDRIGRIAHRQQHREAADDADRHRYRRDQCRAQRAEKQEDDDHDENKRDQQRDQNVVDRVEDKGRRVVIDEIFETQGKSLAQALHIGADQLRGLHGVGPGGQIYADRDRRLAVEAALDILVLGAEFDPSHVLDS